MNILYIASSDPRSIRNGGEQRIHFIWEALKKLGNVSMVIPVNHYSEEKSDPAAQIYWVSFERRYTLSWFIDRLLNRLIPGFVFSPAYSLKRLTRYGIPTPDVCVVRPASKAVALRTWRLAPTCIDMDDIPLAEFDIETQVKGNTLRRRIQRLALKHVQETSCRKGARVWIADEAEFARFPNVPVSFVPNIPVPPLPDFADELGSSDTLFFIGFLAHGPNQTALDWFFSEIWPALKKRHPELRFEVVGGGLPEKYKAKWSALPDVTLHGFVEDLRPCYQKALAILTPMRIGSGTCLKVLEALRMGRPLLSTQQGLRGIRPEDRTQDNGILPFSDVETLLDAIDALRDSDRRVLQHAAVAFVQRRNTQEFIDSAVRQDVEENVLTEKRA